MANHAPHLGPDHLATYSLLQASTWEIQGAVHRDARLIVGKQPRDFAEDQSKQHITHRQGCQEGPTERCRWYEEGSVDVVSLLMSWNGP
jgi:hypothetical protein